MRLRNHIPYMNIFYFYRISYPTNSVIIFDQAEVHTIKKLYAKKENVHAFVQHVLSYLEFIIHIVTFL